MGTPHLLDPLTGAVVGIDFDHYMIHTGRVFTAHYQSSAPLPTNAGEETAIAFLPPTLVAGGLIHMMVDAQADDESTLEIREAPTVTLDQGTIFVPLNRNRNSARVSTMGDRSAVPVVPGVSTYNVAEAAAGNLSGGTILHHETIGQAANPVGFSAGKTRGAREFPLLPSTSYVVILTNLTANNTVHNIVLNWYEFLKSPFRP